MTGRVLYIITCGAPPARDVPKLIHLAQAQNWDVCVIATPSGSKFLNMPELEQLSGHPVRSDYKEPGTPDVLPPSFSSRLRRRSTWSKVFE
jgi:phosphopantothenoylcysteine decarboxylase